MNYFDTSYIVRLYFEELGWQEVRRLRTSEPWICCLHGKVEVLAAFHRKFRENLIDTAALRDTIGQFEDDCVNGEFDWLPITDEVVSALSKDFSSLPSDCFLRAADALHLACARDHGVKTVYSNDKNLLGAARYFGIRARNVIGPAAK